MANVYVKKYEYEFGVQSYPYHLVLHLYITRKILCTNVWEISLKLYYI
jgi:hypothetical protein